MTQNAFLSPLTHTQQLILLTLGCVNISSLKTELGASKGQKNCCGGFKDYTKLLAELVFSKTQVWTEKQENGYLNLVLET